MQLVFLQKRIIEVMAGAIIVGGFLYLLSNGFLLCYWVNVAIAMQCQMLLSSILFHCHDQIRMGKLNTLVNKFMCVSR